MSNAEKTKELKLFTVLLGCKPKGRNIEQHDVMFAVAEKLDDLSETIKGFWYKTVLKELTNAVKKSTDFVDVDALEKELMKKFSRRDKIHIDAWMTVKYVNGYKVSIKKKGEHKENDQKLFFINLGGYKENEFEEFHKKLFVVAPAVSEALHQVMHLDFMKEYSPESLGIAGGAHLDDQYKIDFEADDIVCVSDSIGRDHIIELEKTEEVVSNDMVIGYVPLNYPD